MNPNPHCDAGAHKVTGGQPGPSTTAVVSQGPRTSRLSHGLPALRTSSVPASGSWDWPRNWHLRCRSSPSSFSFQVHTQKWKRKVLPFCFSRKTIMPFLLFWSYLPFQNTSEVRAGSDGEPAWVWWSQRAARWAEPEVLASSSVTEGNARRLAPLSGSVARAAEPQLPTAGWAFGGPRASWRGWTDPVGNSSVWWTPSAKT